MKAIGYYADFVVFPIVLAVLLLLAHRYGRGEIHPLSATLSICGGIFLWTFLEYMIHRFILHGGRIFSADHEAHHNSPKELIGTPVWLTLGIMVFGIYLPAMAILNAGRGLMFGFGLTAGYLTYSFAHYALHHRNIPNIGLLQRWKRLHALHHFSASTGNFGVTSSLWDHVFGTALQSRKRRAARA